MLQLSPDQPTPIFAGVSVEALAAEHGTPLYVYDGDLIERRVERMRTALSYRPLRIFYSAKANAAIAIAALARELGLGLDACSPGDLLLARRAGFQRSELTYTGFGTTDDELRSAAAGAATLVADDLGELVRMAALGITGSVGVRVNPSIDAGFHTHVKAGARDAKFGLPVEDVRSVCARADELGLRVNGLHAHIGSDVLDASVHAGLLRTLAALARDRPELEWINLGGGWGTPRRAGAPEYDWGLIDAAAHDALAGTIELRLEPGGYVLMDAGVLVTRVVGIKPPSPGRMATVAVDTNTNHVISALLYGAHHPTALVRAGGGETSEYRVVGNLMQAGDVLVPSVALPQLRQGDLILLGHVGAYSSARAGTFNERPRPAEVLVRNGIATQIRRRETEEDLFARDLPL